MAEEEAVTKQAHVEIVRGVAKPHQPWWFYVDVVGADGIAFTMWDGASYDSAILEAGKLEPDFGPVIDLVALT